MLGLVGYSDRLGLAPGDTIRFMVSSEHDRYDTRLVRLVHGDTNPAGPGLRQVVVPSSIDGERHGRRQAIVTGSFATIPLGPAGIGASSSFVVFVQPTAPAGREQVIAGVGAPFAEGGRGSGWALAIAPDGELEAVIAGPDGPIRVTSGVPLARWAWAHVGLVRDGRRIVVWQLPVRGIGDPVVVDAQVGPGVDAPDGSPLLLAAAGVDGAADADQGAASGPGRSGTIHHLDGRLDRPRLFDRALSATELGAAAADPDALADAAGAWDFSLDIGTDRLTDVSGRGRHGTTVNMPARAVAGWNHSGRETDWRLAPDEYGAIHFHRDDLEDAGWAVDFELEVPADLPSGIYAAWLRAGDDEEYLPFVVRPSRGTTGSRIAVLVSTLTYVTYANFTDIGRDAWCDDAYRGDAQAQPYADATLHRDVYRHIDEELLHGLYDVHADGSARCHGSALRPILNMRPTFRYRTLAAPARFPADLYLVDWLDHHGIEVDYLTDHDLIDEGVDLLARYAVVLSSSHHEYWTSGMLDSLDAYLAGGGRFMYLGGNGLFGVVTVDPARPHRVELRRWGTSWPFEMPPAERHHAMTGELGGTWRNRGRSPHRVVGVGTAGAGFDRGSPYRRMPDSDDPRVAFVFDGIDGDLIGDEPNLQVRWGAAGYEFDRVEPELGSPAGTLRLASSVRFDASHRSMVDDEMFFMQGRDGSHVRDPQVPGRPHRFARADIAYLEYPGGGAVFSAGSICWNGSLSARDYRGTVSRVTENVLRRFADPDWRRG